MNPIDAETKIAERMRFGIDVQMGKEFIEPLDEIKLDTWCQHFTHSVWTSFRLAVYGAKYPEYRIEYPSTWWDATKKRFCPAWARRWVKWNVAGYDLVAMYPGLNTKIKEEQIAGVSPCLVWRPFGEALDKPAINAKGLEDESQTE